MENLINNLTQKDEQKAFAAAQEIINTKNVKAFNKLCEKSDFLFDFVKQNVKKRLKKAINEHNVQNLKAFLTTYSNDYSDTLIGSIAKYANEDISDEMYDLLENGTLAEKTYAAKYFYYIPDTIAQDKLEEYAISNDLQLAVNSALALGSMGDKKIFNEVLNKLNTKDDFELMNAVRFLTAYADKSAVEPLLKTLPNTTMAENIAAEIPYLMPLLDMFETQDKHLVLTCFDYILLGLGEILPLCQVFDFEIFEVLQYLIKTAKNNSESHCATVLLRALEKFSTLTSNEEYIFDESKDIKDEVKAISDLLKLQPKEFWNNLKSQVKNELNENKPRCIAALEIIRALEIKTAENAVIDFINLCNDESIILLATSVVKVLGGIKQLNQNEIIEKVTNPTSKAILSSYFI